MRSRNTIQKSLILEMVQKLHCHPTADEVYAAVAAKYPNISRATVYRNLKQLAAMGKISEIETPGSADHFDCRLHGHYHVRCVKCGCVFDVEMEYLSDLEKLVKDANGFQLMGHDLMFKGICPACGGQVPATKAHTGAQPPANIK